MRYGRRTAAYYDAVDRNSAKWDMECARREMDYWQSVARALMNMTGGDGRLNWEKGYEECVRHRLELEAKYGKPKDGFVSQTRFRRAVCERARKILNKPAAHLCMDRVFSHYNPYPTEEDFYKSAQEVVADTLFHGGG